MPGHDLVVIGASAGGVEALREIVGQLPADFPAAVLAVVHFPADGTSLLPLILARRGPLAAVHGEEGAEIRPGTIYVVPPDCHLLVRGGRIHLSRGPRENGHRPAVDPLFRSAALAYGPRVIAVVLSGNLDDGAAGLAVVRRHGGATVVQDPRDALYPGMPTAALEAGAAQHVAPLAAIPALLMTLVNTPAEESPPVDDTLDRYEDAVTGMRRVPPVGDPPGEPAGLVCPECKGSLFEIRDGELVRYRCRVGHSYGGRDAARGADAAGGGGAVDGAAGAQRARLALAPHGGADGAPWQPDGGRPLPRVGQRERPAGVGGERGAAPAQRERR